ncbi:MAG TPA: His/Gly/Thr/Pro-type tRNA ligase C-terminal domain-containing protein, partial [Elusimicrobiales bacterium]|nr:His/Gly/Thr/Pro-type tRNA ligase C-terminal domain-containing protein [Elusimicrobiales bacterium]
RLLGAAGVKYNVNPNLVRGLDYYSRTVFEVRSTMLGSQDAVAGGGRYDDLVKSMGGPAAPAIGWGMGVDRLAMLLKDKVKVDNAPSAFVVAASPQAQDPAFGLLTALRAAGVGADSSNLALSLKSQMRSADKSGAAYALIIGEDELKAGTVTVKPLKEKGDQFTLPIQDAPKEIEKRIPKDKQKDSFTGRVIRD